MQSTKSADQIDRGDNSMVEAWLDRLPAKGVACETRLPWQLVLLNHIQHAFLKDTDAWD